jgi:hypothetical protein
MTKNNIITDEKINRKWNWKKKVLELFKRDLEE